jgi:hypothetical protein
LLVRGYRSDELVDQREILIVVALVELFDPEIYVRVVFTNLLLEIVDL